MPTFVALPKILPSPLLFVPERRFLRVKLLREGLESEGKKELILYRDPKETSPLCRFATYDLTGLSRVSEFQASEIDGFLYAIGLDLFPPIKYRGTGLTVEEDATLVFDISTGSSSSVPTVPATAEALVRVDDVPANRVIVAVEKDPTGQWRVCGFGESVSGEIDLELQVSSSSGYAVALDDFGTEFLAGAAVEVGRRVRPTVFRGWLYEVTEAGNLPSIEPEWWIAEAPNAARLIGSARVVAVRYYRPLAHGPFPFELI